jgi:hypothetical protein
MNIRTFTIALSLVALTGCVDDLFDDDDDAKTEETKKSEAAVMKSRHETAKNTIGNVR